MNVIEQRQAIARGEYDAAFNALYPEGETDQRERYLHLTEEFGKRFGEGRPVILCSAPGCIELGGNHTDRQQGRALAAAITLDLVAVLSRNDRNVVRIYSEGYGEDRVNLEKLEIVPGEAGTPAALIRGIAARFYELDLRFGGFDAYVGSEVRAGAGLSSSAAYEVLVGSAFAQLYSGGRVPPVVLAKMGQFAETIYFGQSCDLMDQCASAVGGFCVIDFSAPGNPAVESISRVSRDYGYAICLVETGGKGEEVEDEGTISMELEEVNRALGTKTLGQAGEARFYQELEALRSKVSERALLRALHFFGENRRVLGKAEALRQGDFQRFLTLVRESGEASRDLLREVREDRPLTRALNLCARLLEEDGAWRVHEDGEQGIVQAFVPQARLEEFRTAMEAGFGAGSCRSLFVRPLGGIQVKPE